MIDTDEYNTIMATLNRFIDLNMLLLDRLCPAPVDMTDDEVENAIIETVCNN